MELPVTKVTVNFTWRVIPQAWRLWCNKKSYGRSRTRSQRFAYLGVEDPRPLAVHLHDQLRIHRQLSAKQQTHPVIRSYRQRPVVVRDDRPKFETRADDIPDGRNNVARTPVDITTELCHVLSITSLWSSERLGVSALHARRLREDSPLVRSSFSRNVNIWQRTKLRGNIPLTLVTLVTRQTALIYRVVYRVYGVVYFILREVWKSQIIRGEEQARVYVLDSSCLRSEIVALQLWWDLWILLVYILNFGWI